MQSIILIVAVVVLVGVAAIIRNKAGEKWFTVYSALAGSVLLAVAIVQMFIKVN